MGAGFELTPEGFERLTAELGELKSSGRKKVADQIRQSKPYGDAIDSSEFEAAKAEQAFLEGRIKELHHILQNAVVVSAPSPGGSVGLGSRVRLRQTASGDELEYLIVGSVEADPAQGRISNRSPVGEALVGKKKGDKVAAQTPRGTEEYVILEVGAP
jgi:transcription elongation factor GreA